MEVYLAVGAHSIPEERAVEFIKRFDFVQKCEAKVAKIVPEGSPLVRPNGLPIYLDDMLHLPSIGIDCTLMPNTHVDAGKRLEVWLPDFDIDWGVASHFQFKELEQQNAEGLLEEGPYCVFYMGPDAGNSAGGAGWNRGPLWHPIDWVTLGRRIYKELGLRIVVVGSNWDINYWLYRISPLLDESEVDTSWCSMIGATGIGDVFAVIQKARFTVSYASGLGIFSSYLKTPTVMFYREKGDSINPSLYISPEPDAATAWVDPKTLAEGKYIGQFYSKDCTGDSLFEEIQRRGW